MLARPMLRYPTRYLCADMSSLHAVMSSVNIRLCCYQSALTQSLCVSNRYLKTFGQRNSSRSDGLSSVHVLSDCVFI